MITEPNRADWWIFAGNNKQHQPDKYEALPIDRLPEPPSWRRYATTTSALIARVPPPADSRGVSFKSDDTVRKMVNAALLLRRPLLVTGKPGSGKSSLASAIAYELNLGAVLEWSITSRSTLKEGLYDYDVLGRLYAADIEGRGLDTVSKDKRELELGRFLRLGPLGTAMLPTSRPRVLLIDEIDKSDVDLPNDLLHILEKGSFEIPELLRIVAERPTVPVRPDDYVANRENDLVDIKSGKVQCFAFPVVIMTSNGEREFSPAFLRRCIRLTMKLPSDQESLRPIVDAYFGNLNPQAVAVVEQVLTSFIGAQQDSRDDAGDGNLATDQLLNAIYLAVQGADLLSPGDLHDAILGALTIRGGM